MMKRVAILAVLILQSSLLFAQDLDKSSINSTPAIVKPARDFLMVNFGYNGWASKPDTVKLKSFGYNFSAALCYDFPINKSHLSFAPGLGISTNVVYLDGQVLPFTDTGALASSAHFLPDTSHYKRYKFVTTYLQAPFELRYFGNKQNRNQGFKAAIGIDVGLLLGSHTKGILPVNGVDVNIKQASKEYQNIWNMAAHVRVGWGHITLFGSYNVTTLFKQNEGPKITPFSVGLSLTGL